MQRRHRTTSAVHLASIILIVAAMGSTAPAGSSLCVGGDAQARVTAPLGCCCWATTVPCAAPTPTRSLDDQGSFCLEGCYGCVDLLLETPSTFEVEASTVASATAEAFVSPPLPASDVAAGGRLPGTRPWLRQQLASTVMLT